MDTETNGFIPELTRVHSLVLRDRDSNQVVSCTNSAPGYASIEHGLTLLENAEQVYGHNALLFDYPALRKVYPRFAPKGVLKDTLITARLAFAHVKDSDFALARQMKLPKQLIGRHSLKAWGYRLNLLKGDYGENTDWSTWTPEMQTYCEQDTAVGKALVLHLQKQGLSAQAVETEHALAEYLAAQEANGFPFDMESAIQLQAQWAGLREAAAVKLRAEFGTWYVSLGEFTPKRNDKKMGYTKDAPVSKLKLVEFNPTSRPHIANRLEKLYGWKATEFTEGGQPKVDEGMLKGLDYPAVKTVREYLTLDKRLGQLAEGKEAWLRLMRPHPDTRLQHIFGRVNQSGTITGRATHSKPNIAQVPKVGKLYGAECRALFGAPPQFRLMGADASGLELRCLAHYLAKYDNGAYANDVLHGDVHSRTLAALDEWLPQDKKGRDVAKTWKYAYLYGAGDTKLGYTLSPGASEKTATSIGLKSRKLFESKLAAVGYLQAAIKLAIKKQGYVPLIDGRRAYIRSDHAALNTLLQGTGAVICKRWIVNFNRKMLDVYGPQGWTNPWAACAWIHDEIQVAVRPAVADHAMKIAVDSIESLTEHFKFRCPLTGEAKLGQHWADTH